MPSLGEPTAPDTEELAHFRERWKEEIREREQKGQQRSLSHSKPGQTAHATSTHKSRRSSAALEVFTLAVTEERNGNQSEANRLYLSAFRLDPNVDMAYHGDEYRPPRSPFISSSSLSLAVATPPSPEGNKNSGPNQAITTTPSLASLFESWSHPLLFAPENEAIGVPINKLPDELIVSILSKFAEKMDVTSIERFAVVSRRAKMLSLDRSVWRQLVHSVFVPAQLSDRTVTLKQLADQYCLDHRRLFIEHPRLRFDGVYISVCPYVRFGLSQNPWITMPHLVTYRRFLRFFPSGEVLAYRANDDQEIRDVIRGLLQPGQQQKDLLLGNWQLIGTTVLVKDLDTTDPTSSGHAASSRFQFQMKLTLGSRPILGRWNKLDLKLYESVHASTGAIAIPLLHERPYWFSKVKSYQ